MTSNHNIISHQTFLDHYRNSPIKHGEAPSDFKRSRVIQDGFALCNLYVNSVICFDLILTTKLVLQFPPKLS